MLVGKAILGLYLLISVAFCRFVEEVDTEEGFGPRSTEVEENTADWDVGPREDFAPREAVRCGQVPVSQDPQEKVINGTVSTPNLFPFMVEFRFTWYHFCGGAVYDKYHIITAAHCIKKSTTTNQITLVFADWNNKANDEGQYSRKVAKITKHPRAFRSFMANDIAILELTEPLEFNDKVQPICIPTGPVNGGEKATVMGWGYTYNTNDKKFLIQADVPIVSKSLCSSKGWYRKSIKSGMICAGYRQGEIDSCQGDSGGPLVRKVGRAYELTGIVSWGANTCARPKKPGVYVDIYHYRNWIKQVAGEPQY